jgi:thiosulfate reductase cytochrome b subunit
MMQNAFSRQNRNSLQGKKNRSPYLILGGLLLLAAVAVFVEAAFAGPQEGLVQQASALHPTFALLDAEAIHVLESGAPLSSMQTCGQCHDTEFIASHSFHSDLGYSDLVDPGETPGSRPWDTSPGLYGKWDPLTYGYLSAGADDRTDLDTNAWIAFNGARLVGGGPAEQSGLEMDCLVCHLTRPDHEARTRAIQSDNLEWASTASLALTGIVTELEDGFDWNPEAFDELGELDSSYISLQDPSNDNCAQCHGVVHTDAEQPLILAGCSLKEWQTATTGQVISGQRISLSGVNLKDKDSFSYPWDIHSERGLQCTDCHFSLNNPAYSQITESSRPSHLQFDPRRLEIGEYLQRPDHNFARGQSAQYTLAPELKDTMRRCETCHDASLHADWLPYVERHMQELACESCHIPQLFAPAIQSYDWTVLLPDGEPSTTCRGIETSSGSADGSVSDLVTGFQPVLLPRRNIDGELLLAPYNLVTSWYWVYQSPDGPRPVPLADLEAAWLSGQGYTAEVIELFDGDGDREISNLELRLDSPEKVALITGRLQALGLQDPQIQGDIQPYSISHNVAAGETAVKDCQACHADESRLAAAILLSENLPGGVTPDFVQDANVETSNGLSVEDGRLFYRPIPADHELYVFGHNRVSWIDILGVLFFLGVLAGVAGHGGLRFYQSLRQRWQAQKVVLNNDETSQATSPSGEAGMDALPVQRVYMYPIYERFWHWLQTFTMVLLLFTGLVIHRPDLLGFLSFRYMVTLHNVLAAILVVNAALSLFYHLVSGEIQQFIPRPYGFFDQAIIQAKYYLGGIFKGANHPFEKTPRRKLNPLQQVTYFGILNVLLPLQILTGALMWGVQRWPEIANLMGGLPFLAPFHSLVAWTFGAFIVGHVYLTTTVGREPLAGIKAMVYGYEEVEVHPNSDSTPHSPASPALDGDSSQPVAAD